MYRIACKETGKDITGWLWSVEKNAEKFLLTHCDPEKHEVVAIRYLEDLVKAFGRRVQ